MRAIVAAAAIALLGCGGKGADAPSNRYQSDPNDPGGSPSSGTPSAPSGGGGGCADRTGEAFSKCARDLYAGKKFAEVIDTCKAAIKNASHSDDEKTAALGVCMSLVPSSLFHQQRLQEAKDLIGTLCRGSSDEDRTNIAARATLMSMLGMDRSVNNEERIKQAIVTFASGCEVDAGRVADRALEISKQ